MLIYWCLKVLLLFSFVIRDFATQGLSFKKILVYTSQMLVVSDYRSKGPASNKYVCLNIFTRKYSYVWAVGIRNCISM
jgi:hypothetical protein